MSTDSDEIPGGVAFVELIRLAIVILGAGLALEIAGTYEFDDTARLVLTALGAGGGYVIGGVLGRFVQGRISTAESRLRTVSTSEIVAGAGGGVIGLLLGAAVSWPVLLFGGKAFTVPIAVAVITTTGWTGWRLGRSRASDLLRYLGAGGRMPSGSRAAGGSYKLVDSSALIDGRLVDVCRGGWIEGVLLVPTFVLYELQGLADAAEPERRRRGQRGLDNLAALQQLASVGVEVLEEHPPGDEVDLQLLAVARSRGTPLLTTDANLARVAEVQGLKVRNLHSLADSLRPPVVPGDTLEVRIAKEGRERHQGVGYLPDGTMVVVERAADAIDATVAVEVTSIMANANGRMLFATRTDRPRPVSRGSSA
ncbi:PIN/TRAM domain-containing protein [Euzebya sp.]|uniref:PIN/TRAM domain-containing protein n=1 Tax=Euzebya sp. TaxID=1971409 RepID=UPI0035188E90